MRHAKANSGLSVEYFFWLLELDLANFYAFKYLKICFNGCNEPFLSELFFCDFLVSAIPEPFCVKKNPINVNQR